jgi:hypothetical protein
MFRKLNKSGGLRLAGVCRAGASLRAQIISLLLNKLFTPMGGGVSSGFFHLGSWPWSFAGVSGSDDEGKPEASALILRELWVA